MKKTAKDKVFVAVKQLTQTQEAVTAQEIADELAISRQNASHYLSRLMKDGKLKRLKGKPVLWKVSESADPPRAEEAIADFSEIVGYDGSLKEVIQQCISAVKYPPHGLSILINGETGVGKSFLAQKIYEYAKEEQVVTENAPFIILNCADYADNPELLSATLFGYKKGAFTGAEKDTPGLLANADNGYLFLDEIHRLSNENQEKLFLFMDSGQYRPLGENSKWSHANVRFIFATTEKSEDFLLDTFARRIQINVELPAFYDRPLGEKIELIQLFFQNEALVLNRDILVSKKVLSLLLSHSFSGNIGRLKNVIKISCASVYSCQTGKQLLVSEQEIAQQLDTLTNVEENLPIEDLLIKADDHIHLQRLQLVDYDQTLARISEWIVNGNLTDNITKVQREVQQLMHTIEQNTLLSKAQRLTANMYRRLWSQILIKKYGLITSGPTAQISSQLYASQFSSKIDLGQAIRILRRTYPRTAYVTDQFISQLPHLSKSERQILQMLVLVVLLDYVDETIELKGLLLAHGDSTASSIQGVVNQLCGNYIFEALDMPVESNISEIVERTKAFVNKQVYTDSLVLIVDMGSLNQIYTQIKNDLKGELLLINNLTTSIALDIGLKMSNNSPFNRIAEDASKKYSINVQYFEGFAPTSNIIISCMSGIGISDKLREIFSNHLDSNRIKVFTKEYRELRSLIDQNDEDYFDKTKLVITTSDLPKSFTIPNVNIYNILDGEGNRYLENTLSQEMTHQEYLELIQELVKFLSLEGVADRLTFLNPAVVMGEVETIISKYETYYHITLNGKVKLNLYMHTALMMERLFLARTGKAEEPVHEMSPEEDEFYYVSRSIFQPMEMKYNFKVNAYELSLLYELIGPFIKR
ncbi:sigma 54-interacting transcriptional regulator [Sporolactobacillus sp. THM19-2]|uniref:sigma 54-interacting transcriptional regulator n=1 Tax=Sporolactobacillus sp. THM19-2 TaxID=2511171 RepID=UPI00101FBCB1|nr:sigma 54-interacting transcriptional regulator [Sporolactobacillus sp. THM19-2]RYL91643.1 AAA family ATPase [Sporolactobacillus sp. THM19-2]